MPRIKTSCVEIEYERTGDPDRPAIVLIMGLGGQLTQWPESLREGLVARGYQVICFDNRDAGKSTYLSEAGVPDLAAVQLQAAAGQPCSIPYALNDMAADTGELLRELGITSAHIVGVSMGGMIAQLMAVEHPTLTRSLISIMSSTRIPHGQPEVMAALTVQPRSPALEDRLETTLQLRKLLMSPGYPVSEEELRKDIKTCLERAPYEPTGVARQMATIYGAPPRAESLEKLTCPALVIHGEDDPLVPVADGVDTARCIPGARLIVIPGMAHDLSSALTPVLLPYIADFLDSVEEAAQTTQERS